MAWTNDYKISRGDRSVDKHAKITEVLMHPAIYKDWHLRGICQNCRQPACLILSAAFNSTPRALLKLDRTTHDAQHP